MLKKVVEGVWIHQSKLLENNTVVVQGKSGVLLIDAGITEDEMVCLANDLRKLDQPVVAGFSTHPDWDHVLWHTKFGEVPRYATSRAADFMQNFLTKPDWKALVTEGLPPEIADETSLELFGLLTGLPSGTTYIPWDGPKVRVIEHPAHATGHAALLIEGNRVLVAGDMLSDVFIPMLNDNGDVLVDYLTGLQTFEGVADDVDFVIPGHGSLGDAEELRKRIKLDRAYVKALRDNQAVSDPRITSPKKGWEWVQHIHEGQLQQFAKNPS